MPSGFDLFKTAETYWHAKQPEKTLHYYQLAVKKVAKDENVAGTIPQYMHSQMPDDFPFETIALVWRNFIPFLKDQELDLADKSPEAIKLLHSYRITEANKHPRFKGAKAELILKAMQITATATIGQLAWDKKDRPTAAKRYKEAIDLAATVPGFNSRAAATSNLERWVATEVQTTKNNLNMLIENDFVNASRVGSEAGRLRKDEIQIPNSRMVEGQIVREESVKMATDGCGNCGKRELKLPRCGKCKKVGYCNSVCQKADWQRHKSSCVVSVV